VSWERFYHDASGTGITISSYALWRRIDDAAEKADPVAAAARQARVSTLLPTGGMPAGEWDCVATVPAFGQDYYHVVSPTLCDSTAPQGICWSVFFVSAHSTDPFVYFTTLPDSGYSVDNIEPQVPDGLLAEFEGTDVALSWDASPDLDFNYFSIYRGTEEGFEPGTPVGYSTTSSYVDSEAGSGQHWYKVTATDVSGNESEPSLPATPGGTGVPGDQTQVPSVLTLGPAIPNPLASLTRIAYGIPAGTSAEHVTLTIYDVSGREVTRVVDTERGPGVYEAVWDGSDSDGHPVASGVYNYRLVWGGMVESKQMVLLR
jgi:hypothetical protein